MKELASSARAAMNLVLALTLALAWAGSRRPPDVLGAAREIVGLMHEAHANLDRVAGVGFSPELEARIREDRLELASRLTAIQEITGSDRVAAGLVSPLGLLGRVSGENPAQTPAPGTDVSRRLDGSGGTAALPSDEKLRATPVSLVVALHPRAFATWFWFDTFQQEHGIPPTIALALLKDDEGRIAAEPRGATSARHVRLLDRVGAVEGELRRAAREAGDSITLGRLQDGAKPRMTLPFLEQEVDAESAVVLLALGLLAALLYLLSTSLTLLAECDLVTDRSAVDWVFLHHGPIGGALGCLWVLAPGLTLAAAWLFLDLSAGVGILALALLVLGGGVAWVALKARRRLRRRQRALTEPAGT